MLEIGVYEAKTHLPQLLKRVEQGEHFIITKHSKAIAELMPIAKKSPEKIYDAIQELKAFQAKHRLGKLSVRQMIEEGRKY